MLQRPPFRGAFPAGRAMTVRVLARQGSRYLVTAGIAAVVDIGLFWLATAAGAAVLPAALASFLIATVVNYRLTARHVFGTAPSWRGYARFLAAAGLGLVVNVGVTGLVATYTPAPAVIAKTIGVGFAFGFNFLLNALLVFRRPPEDGIA